MLLRIGIFLICVTVGNILSASIESVEESEEDEPLIGKPKDSVSQSPFSSTPPVQKYQPLSFEEQQITLVEMITRLHLNGSDQIPEPSKNLFHVLKKCSIIFQKFIGNELVGHKMLQNSLLAFQLLFEHLDDSNLTPRIFGDIMKILGKCENEGNAYDFRVSSCPMEIEMIKKTSQDNVTVTLYQPIVPTSRKFKEFENDLIVEVVWKIFNFCHAKCYEYFTPQLSHYHYMTQAMELLFSSSEIQSRWFRSTGGLSYIRGIISASNLETRMKNLDFAVSAAHLNSEYKPWLRKPLPKTI